VAAVFQARQGRLLVTLGLTFLGLAVAFRTVELPALERLYALTFPWSQDYRLLMIVTICASLLAGAGLVRISEMRGSVLRMRRAAAISLALTCLVPATLILMAQRFAAESTFYLTFSPDDAMALRWLGAHLQPGDLVVNDGSADAGIWAPYKSGASILLPRVLPVPDRADRQQLLEEFGDATSSQQSVADACGLGARYLYVGASGTTFDKRQLPSPETLLRSGGLDEVFSQGSAAVFQFRCS
jgi:hypothetical protein